MLIVIKNMDKVVHACMVNKDNNLNLISWQSENIVGRKQINQNKLPSHMKIHKYLLIVYIFYK